MEEEPRQSFSFSRITHLPQPQPCVRLARHRDGQGPKPLAAQTARAEREQAAASTQQPCAQTRARPDARRATAQPHATGPQMRTESAVKAVPSAATSQQPNHAPPSPHRSRPPTPPRTLLHAPSEGFVKKLGGG